MLIHGTSDIQKTIQENILNIKMLFPEFAFETKDSHYSFKNMSYEISFQVQK